MLPLALEPSGHMQGICRAELAAHVSAASRCPRRPHAKNMQKKQKHPNEEFIRISNDFILI
jgi:hypothetical protein